jgi:hypothetical protein
MVSSWQTARYPSATTCRSATNCSPVNARGLAHRLRQYDVRSCEVRVDLWHGKGYKREDLYDAWTRYLSRSLVIPPGGIEEKGEHTPPNSSATSATNATEPQQMIFDVLGGKVIDEQG